MKKPSKQNDRRCAKHYTIFYMVYFKRSNALIQKPNPIKVNLTHLEQPRRQSHVFTQVEVHPEHYTVTGPRPDRPRKQKSVVNVRSISATFSGPAFVPPRKISGKELGFSFPSQRLAIEPTQTGEACLIVSYQIVSYYTIVTPEPPLESGVPAVLRIFFGEHYLGLQNVIT